ncbi:ankyrin repeat [Mactra antiquata]
MADKYHRAAKDGYLDILKNGNRKEMNTPDEDGCTPTMLAAANGNMEALRTIVTRGGDVDKYDLLGFTAMHYAARNGHLNCISFLINFGANIWLMDNDMHTALEIAGLENREEIVKLLDAAQTEQLRKNPKVVQKLKESAMRDAERNLKYYERLQEKASKEMERHRKQMGDVIQNGDFKPPTKKSFVKTLTMRIKGNTAKSKNAKQSTAFSDLVNGTTKSSQKKHIDAQTVNDFKVSELDNSGKRTLRSVHGTATRRDAQVMYVANIDIDGDNEKATDNSLRPALTNVFPGASLGMESQDSGVDGMYDDDDNDASGGIFNRQGFGKFSFLNHFNHANSFQDRPNASLDDIDGENGGIEEGMFDSTDSKRNSAGTDLTDGSSGRQDMKHDLPWNAEDVEQLADEEDDTEYTPVIMFLEGCGLTHYTHLFLDGDVDMEALMTLTNQDFQDMGLPIGPRRKLMNAIQTRRTVLNEPAQMYDSQL